MSSRLFALGLGLFLLGALRAPCADPIFVRFNTNLGNIDVELLPNAAPLNVANFLTYVDSGAYTNSFIHRSVPGFVIQGGGYYYQAPYAYAIPANAPVVNEFKVSNTRGTLAMAKTSDGPDTATNQWFFNEVDNSANLDNQNGGFTVFGMIATSSGLSVMDQISTLSIYTLGSAPFDSVPLINYTGTFSASNLVTVNSITRLTQTFNAWMLTYFPTQSGDPSIYGPGGNPMHDRVPNLLKYLCDIAPNQAMTAADRAALPVITTTTISGAKYFILTYRQYAQKTGITVNAQTSSDLVTWTTVSNPTMTQLSLNSATGDPTLQVQVPASGTRAYIRLNVTMP